MFEVGALLVWWKSKVSGGFGECLGRHSSLRYRRLAALYATHALHTCVQIKGVSRHSSPPWQTQSPPA